MDEVVSNPVVERRVLVSHGINWIWYLCADFNNVHKTVRIYYYERWHKYDNPRHPQVSPADVDVKWDILEDGQRVVYGINVGTDRFRVVNQGYVFSYKDMSVLKLEPQT